MQQKVVKCYIMPLYQLRYAILINSYTLTLKTCLCQVRLNKLISCNWLLWLFFNNKLQHTSKNLVRISTKFLFVWRAMVKISFWHLLNDFSEQLQKFKSNFSTSIYAYPKRIRTTSLLCEFCNLLIQTPFWELKTQRRSQNPVNI